VKPKEIKKEFKKTKKRGQKTLNLGQILGWLAKQKTRNQRQ